MPTKVKENSSHKNFIGTRASVELKNGLTMNVRVLQYKFSYGKDRYLVTPVSGSGEVWVQNIKPMH